jgi:hypothetical protein
VGSAWNDVKGAAGDAYGELKKVPVLGSVLSGPQTGSTQPDTQAIRNAGAVQGQLNKALSGFQGAYSPTQAALNTQNQNANIAQLQAQANGTAPSAAQLQLQQQGQQNAAAAYGQAAALQGRNPGQALRQALQASTATQAATNAQAAQLRAQEQASGQQALAGALSGMQGQQQNLRGQDLGQTQNLYGDILGASGQQITGAGNQTGANVNNAATTNSFNGGVIGGAAGAATAAIKSDRTEKTDLKAAPLDKLADALQGFTFEYKHPGTPGEAPGPRVGVMAQDALRGGPAGRAMVSAGGDGKLALDGGNALGAALAMGAEALRRTRKAA